MKKNDSKAKIFYYRTQNIFHWVMYIIIMMNYNRGPVLDENILIVTAY